MSVIHRASGDPARQQRLGPYVIEELVTAAEERAVTAWRVRIAAGETTSVSFHRVAEELYFVLAGSGTAVLDGRPVPLVPGDFLRLPPGTTHGFTAGPDGLDLLDVHAPGCRPDRDTYFVGDAPPGFTGG
jgi:mannose-6-phosphate isomerase-like protein (cupin superfamily)